MQNKICKTCKSISEEILKCCHCGKSICNECECKKFVNTIPGSSISVCLICAKQENLLDYIKMENKRK